MCIRDRSFVGAIAGKHGDGLFVTTAKFSQKAKDYANTHHIILIDGERLADVYKRQPINTMRAWPTVSYWICVMNTVMFRRICRHRIELTSGLM